MPNISFDIFFDQDFINLSASRSKHAPKAKPEWKVRTAPKLPPKEAKADPTASPRPVPRPTINSTRPVPQKLNTQPDTSNRVTELSESGSVTSERRKPPKLGPKKSSPLKDTVKTNKS